ncbi:hypothetical protein MF265_05650 [Serratia marcescens]|uniref:hypothetical protein n=1 Tax=Serratia marcescens TaxID=615 RepID=UPI001EF13147|nr:hypothetical protein [Serratia marcescens]ULH12265.1 hypothetical protein MF265_05650 [Serratia marcescens]
MERDQNETPAESRRIDALEMEAIDRDIRCKILLGVVAASGAAALAIIWYFF